MIRMKSKKHRHKKHRKRKSKTHAKSKRRRSSKKRKKASSKMFEFKEANERRTRSRSRKRKRNSNHGHQRDKNKRSQSKPPSLRNRSRSKKRKKKKKHTERRNSTQAVIPSILWLSRQNSVKTIITLKDRQANEDNQGRSKSFDPNMKAPPSCPPMSTSSSFGSQYGNAPVPKGFKQRQRAKSSTFKFAIQTNVFDEYLIESDEKMYFLNSPVLGNNPI